MPESIPSAVRPHTHSQRARGQERKSERTLTADRSPHRCCVPLFSQFEYHPSLPLMAIGTVDGLVYLADWDRNQQLGHATLPVLAAPPGQPQGGDEGINVLALAWLRRDPSRFVAAAAHGGAALYSVDLSRQTAHLAEEACEALEADGSRPWGSSSRGAPTAAASSSSSAPASDPNALSLVHRYNAPLAPKLTSMHCNADDTLLSGSGYTHSVFISDLATGFKLRTLKNIHEGHVNIARFANQLPYLLLTSSFDHTLKCFDLRSNHTVRKGDVDVPVPIYTCSSRSGNVMVCFSPNDTYFLSSAVDNEVRQYHVRDGSLHLEYDIPKHNITTNYTRSYYCNEGECIISGASNSDLLYVASSVDGSIIDTVDMVSEGSRKAQCQSRSCLNANSLSLCVCPVAGGRPSREASVHSISARLPSSKQRSQSMHGAAVLPRQHHAALRARRSESEPRSGGPCTGPSHVTGIHPHAQRRLPTISQHGLVR